MKVPNSRINVVNLLTEMSSTCMRLAMAEEERNGKTEYYKKQVSESCRYQEAINLLTDRHYFNDIWNIYMGDAEG